MRSVVLWAWRGSGPWLFLSMAGFLIASVIASHQWSQEFDWGARHLAAAAYIFAPLVAGAAAYDTARRGRPSVQEIGLGAPRGGWVVIAPALAVLAWAVLAALVSWCAVAVVVVLNRGFGPTDLWVYLETVTVLAAAAFLGAVVGCLVEGMVAVAVAVGVVLLPALLLGPAGVSLFQVASSSGTMLGLERTPARAVLAIVVNGSVVLVAVAVTLLHFRSPRRPLVWATAPWATVAVVAVLSATWPIDDSEYRPEATQVCRTADDVEVCGPPEAARFWLAAAQDLAAARSTLQAADLPLPSRFAVARGAAVTDLPPGTAALDLDTASVRNGHLSHSVMASTLSTPRACAGFFDSAEAIELLELADTVRVWLSGELDEPSGGPAPAEVTAAYEVLSSCPTP